MPYSDPSRQREYQRAWKQSRTFRIQQIKEATPCADCGRFYPAVCMDFDHVNGEKIERIAFLRTYTWERVETEMKKCEIVCANCHRLRTQLRLVAQRYEAVVL